ncbi:MAG: iron ABC transporter permease [Pseudomonadota bacterium]
MRGLLTLTCLLLALPVLGVLGAWLAFDAAAWAVLTHQAQTVLAGYALQSLLLAVFVALGVALVGGGAAAAVALFDFPGRRIFEWALLLPMAMPAYVLAYAYTDFLQFSGPAQTALRALTGLEGALWPDVRSLPGAVVLFVLCLYPYVYLLVRTALAERGVQMMEAARLLGAGLWRRIGAVALPLSRPALVAGVALALMETLADYGVGAYFGLTTFSTGIYKAWLVMNDRIAAAQLASLLLLLVAALLWAERHARKHLRFASSRSASQAGANEARAVPLQGRLALLAWSLCALPIALGFLLPLALLARLVWQEARFGAFGLPLARFAQWSLTSFQLAALAAVLASALALALAFALRLGASRADRRWPTRLLGAAARTVALGYALPGAVIAVGILLPVAAVQAAWPGVPLSAIVTGSIVGLLYAYLVRFSAVALQSMEAGYARLPASLDDSARMLGASRGRLLAEVHLPLLRRSVLAAALLVFVDVMKELPATLVLRPFNSDTLAVVAYNLARDERLAEAALPSLAIVVVGLLPVLLLSRAMRR